MPPKPRYNLNEEVIAHDRGEDYKAKILRIQDDKVFLHWQMWDRKFGIEYSQLKNLYCGYLFFFPKCCYGRCMGEYG